MRDLRPLVTRAASGLQRWHDAATAQRRGKLARVIEVQSFGTGAKLAVVEFSGQTLLLSVRRDGIAVLATGSAS